MHKRRPKAFRGKGMKAYVRSIEIRNRDLRKQIYETKCGANQVHAMTNAILAAVVDKFGPFEIDMPKLGGRIKAEHKEGKLYLTRADE